MDGWISGHCNVGILWKTDGFEQNGFEQIICWEHSQGHAATWWDTESFHLISFLKSFSYRYLQASAQALSVCSDKEEEEKKKS